MGKKFKFQDFRHVVLSENERVEELNILKDLMQNKEEIKSIGVIGEYGSGKTTLITSAIKSLNVNCEKKNEFKSIRISLAEYSKNNECKNELIKEVYSLENEFINQLFFESKKIDKKVLGYKSLKKISKLFIILSVSMSLIINLILIDSIKNKVNSIKFINNYEYGFDITLGIFILIISCIFYFIIYKIYYNYVITKVEYAGITLKFDDKNEPFNTLLSKILYIFKIEKYNALVIEDIDRYENQLTVKILEKLKNICNVLNSKLPQKIIFIYALSDKVFKKEDKTKFFDVVVPVEPFSTFATSKKRFDEVLPKGKYMINEDFLQLICIYITDMRFIHNVCNEYKLLCEKDRKFTAKDSHFSRNKEKFMAFILYKNYCSIDYLNLLNREGYIYNFFQNKNQIIDRIKEDINLKILKEKRNKEITKNVLEINKSSIRKLKKEYNAAQYMSLKDFYNSYKKKIVNYSSSIFEGLKDEYKDKDGYNFMKTLLFNGYIKEDYSYYLSMNYNVSENISYEDYTVEQYIESFKNSTSLPYNYEIKAVDKLLESINIKKLYPDDIFINNYLLIYGLNNNEKHLIKLIFESIIQSGDHERIDNFLNNFINNENSKNGKLFYNYITNNINLIDTNKMRDFLRSDFVNNKKLSCIIILNNLLGYTLNSFEKIKFYNDLKHADVLKYLYEQISKENIDKINNSFEYINLGVNK